MTRRWSGEWGAPAAPGTPVIDILIPSFTRSAELAVTLAGLAAQDGPDFRIIISDQTDGAPGWDSPAVQAMLRVLRAQGRGVLCEHHLPRRGLAENRSFLLARADAPYVLYLDNDVWLEPGMLQRMHSALTESGGGFIGSAVQGLSYLRDDRPHERTSLEFWPRRRVRPERMRPGSPEFGRWRLHNAANLAHAAIDAGVEPGGWLLYKVAWVGGCVLFDRAALVMCGGFDFWEELPADHAGEDVAAQWRVMERFGGAGLLPSGAVHLESPTTVPRRNVDAAEVIHGTKG